jgi:hypothetical protein
MAIIIYKAPHSLLSGEILAFTGKINQLIFAREPPEPIDLSLFLIE